MVNNEKFNTVDIEKAFQYVLMVAEEKGVSKRELCLGIYDYSSFIKMSNHKQGISTDVVIQCAEKLKISIPFLFDYARTEWEQ